MFVYRLYVCIFHSQCDEEFFFAVIILGFYILGEIFEVFMQACMFNIMGK